MHLFLVVLGGRSRGCHIEQHDVRFVAGAQLDDTLPQLRSQWFGLQRGLHLDSWQRIERVEGWRVVLRREPAAGPQRLWFVNLGAYDPACPAELHAFGLFVAGGAAQAAAAARRRLLVGALQQHKDDRCALAGLSVPAAPAGDRPQPAAVPPDPSMRAPAGRTATARSEAGGRPHHAGLSAGTGPSGSLAAEVDDVLPLRRLGRWHVHLLPPQPGESSDWQPLRPDWFGYRRIDS